RHESLRTVFPARGGEPELVVLAPYAPSMPTHDLSRLAAEARDAALAALREAHMRARFDLEREPALRVTAIRVAEDEHTVLFTQHHVSTDGRSLMLFARAWASTYEALASGRAPPGSPEATATYSAFVAREGAYLASEACERSTRYWRAQLEGLPDPYAAIAPAPTRTHRGATLGFALTEAETRELSALAKRLGATLFAAMASLFAAVLARLTGEQVVPLGTAVESRPAGFTETLGFFTKTVVIRAETCPGDTFG